MECDAEVSTRYRRYRLVSTLKEARATPREYPCTPEAAGRDASTRILDPGVLVLVVMAARVARTVEKVSVLNPPLTDHTPGERMRRFPARSEIPSPDSTSISRICHAALELVWEAFDIPPPGREEGEVQGLEEAPP